MSNDTLSKGALSNSTLLQNATGPIEFKMTNDYMFRAVCQKNELVLKGLICSLLNLSETELKSIVIQNPICLGEAIHDKDIILDLHILLNDEKRLNIEMQVANEGDWCERSVFYLCRSFCQLQKGKLYLDTLPTVQIGILNFSLFPDSPEFYARNLLMNSKTHEVYSSKIALHVLSLESTDLATDEDRACKLDYWAKLFKAKTWEDMKMLAKNNTALHEAAVTLRELSADEKIRLQCEARERYEMDQRAILENGVRQGIKQGLEQGIEQGTKRQKELDAAIIAEKNKALSEKEKALFEKDKEIAALKTKLDQT